MRRRKLTESQIDAILIIALAAAIYGIIAGTVVVRILQG